MAEPVYMLCAGASLLCALMLFRTYRQTHVRLLLWSTLCFLGFALNNVVLVIDLVFLPERIDLSVTRTMPAVFGLFAMIYGLIWDVK
jgi:hypothetical protein